MTKRRDTKAKKRFGPEAIVHEFTSGVTGFITPLEIENIRLLEVALEETFPMPPQPTEDIPIMGDPDNTETMVIGAGEPKFDDWVEACTAINEERAAYQMDWLLEHCLVIEDSETEKQKQALVDAFAPRRAIGESLGQEYEGESEWAITLRHFILAGHEDWADLMLASRINMFVAVKPEDVTNRVKSFRR